MDADGYPSDDELEAIKNWPWSDCRGLLEYVRERWMWPDMWREQNGWINVSTGGWSGNEELIGALKENRMFWLLCWYSSTRGGHYVFDLSRMGER